MKLSSVLIDSQGQPVDGSTLTEDQLNTGDYQQFDEVLEAVLELGVSKEDLIKFINNPFTVGVVFSKAE